MAAEAAGRFALGLFLRCAAGQCQTGEEVLKRTFHGTRRRTVALSVELVGRERQQRKVMSETRMTSRFVRVWLGQLRVRKSIVELVAAACLLVGSPALQAYRFMPSDSEWLSWTRPCKARYTTTQIGSRSKFAGTVSDEEMNTWGQRYGEVFLHVHHYCAALIYFNRANLPDSMRKRPRGFLLKRAIEEAEYTRQRTPEQHFLYPSIVLLQAQAHDRLGESEKAMAMAREAMAKYPEYGPTYALMSILLRRVGKAEDARDVLLEGLERAATGHAELHYFLGLTYVTLKDFDAAQKHADQAASGGYPLTGLQNALARHRAQ